MAPAGMTVSTRNTRRPLLSACAAGCALFALASRPLSFVGAGAAAPQPEDNSVKQVEVSRREVLRWMPAAAAVAGGAAPGLADSGTTKPWVTRPDGSEDTIHTGGVKWEDIKIGTGAEPKIGQLVAINFVAIANVREKEITIEDTAGKAKDYRFGIGQMLPGMDEGVRGMKTGGQRKLYIPGELAFGAKAVPAAVGRPQVPSYTPLEVTVTLEFIPGSDDVYEAYATDI